MNGLADSHVCPTSSMAKSFRLRSQFDTQGLFWDPNEPSTTFAGRLARTRRGIELTSSPILKKIDTALLAFGKPEYFNSLHGSTTEGPCSLFYVQSPAPSGLTDQTGQSIKFREYRVGLCVFGLHLPDFESLFAGSVTFRYTGLHEWIPRQPHVSTTKEAFVVTHRTDLPAVFDLRSPAIGSRIRLEIDQEFSGRLSGEFETRHEARLLVEPAEPRSLEWFLRVGYRLEHVFTLLLGTSVVLKGAEITSEGKTGWLVRKTTHVAEKTDPSVWIRCTDLQLIQAVHAWLGTPEEFRELENLVFVTLRQSSLFEQTRFLHLAQALESLHRLTDDATIVDRTVFGDILDELRKTIARVCENKAIAPVSENIELASRLSELAGRLEDSIRNANEPSFKVRIERLLARLSEDHRKNLVGDAVEFEMALRQTRNDLTHPGIEKRSKVLTSARDIFLFNQKLLALLRLLLLMHIGLPADVVFEQVLRQATKWQ